MTLKEFLEDAKSLSDYEYNLNIKKAISGKSAYGDLGSEGREILFQSLKDNKKYIENENCLSYNRIQTEMSRIKSKHPDIDSSDLHKIKELLGVFKG